MEALIHNLNFLRFPSDGHNEDALGEPGYAPGPGNFMGYGITELGPYSGDPGGAY